MAIPISKMILMSSPAGWNKTADDIAAEIAMAQTNHRGAYLVLEGPSDELFFRRFVSKKVYIVQANGRKNVEDAMLIIDTDSSYRNTKVLGIIDEDYDWSVNYMVASKNIIKFDPRDLESMLIRSDALDSVLIELGDNSKINSFCNDVGNSVRSVLVKKAEFFGRLRIYNQLNSGVSLKKFKPMQFFNKNDWSYDHGSACKAAVKLGVHTNASQLQTQIDLINIPSDWHCARGHDLIDILVGGLKSVLGVGTNISASHVEMLLRQSMSGLDGAGTNLFARISQWELRRASQILT